MTIKCRDRQIARINMLLNAMRDFEDWEPQEDETPAVELLTQIQQVIVSIGNVLEADQSSVQCVISQLEEACELIYQMSVSLGDMGKAWSYKQKIEACLKGVQSDLGKADIRKEIVFLPYQVSMWDSLESVWLAARQDSSVDSYVVPIPFYDVLPDGTLGELHDQRNDYPDYVPVTSCEEYILEERQPDMIFFHNPYDACNHVTRVPERYYASALKKYCKQLIYIPYFVTAPGGPADQQCYMPGVLFADKVIVQPGEIYEKYCRVYTATLRENGWEHLFVTAEDKFLPLGSPKSDKLRNMKCKISDLPEDWQKVILKPDGSKKKIILYNLTIDVMLAHKELVLNKAEHVFQIFKEKKDEIAFIWRPHPLLLNAISSMRPELCEAYQQMICRFREEGWGIFDETPDPNLAMALSDAYYGDWSSLVETYRETGKPIVLQNVLGEDEVEKILDTKQTCKPEGVQGQVSCGKIIYEHVVDLT